MDTKSLTCCFSGHRTLSPEQYLYLSEKLSTTLIELIEQGMLYFGAGGALGFDTLAAQTVFDLKKIYPQIRLIQVLPCRSQTEYCSHKDKAIYNHILERSSKVVYVSENYSQDCLFKRNRHLVNASGTCVCYLTEPGGGTEYTVRYAKAKGLKILNLAQNELK